MKKRTKKEDVYPCLKVNNSKFGSLVVFFFKEQEGVCVSTTNSDNFVGEYSDDWCEFLFVNFDGEITLSNN